MSRHFLAAAVGAALLPCRRGTRRHPTAVLQDARGG
jgi:hypothetical protein